MPSEVGAHGGADVLILTHHLTKRMPNIQQRTKPWEISRQFWLQIFKLGLSGYESGREPNIQGAGSCAFL